MRIIPDAILLQKNPTNDPEIEYLQDIWRLSVVGIKPLPYMRSRHIKFTGIEPLWLRQSAKQFFRFEAATKALHTLQQYMNAMRHFAHFIEGYDSTLQPSAINRQVIVHFMQYIYQIKLNNVAKNKLISHVKLFLTLAGRENWADITKEKIVYREDRLPLQRSLPRYIPNSVLDQLNQQLGKLSPQFRRITLLLLHTGRRVGELCALKRDCLITDSDGDYLLRYYEFKMKKEEIIPINAITVQAIQEQNAWLIQHESLSQSDYLFPDKDARPMEPCRIGSALNDLGTCTNIRGPTGEHWWFQLHQFRHTVGTQMINAGTPVHIVQRYLGHASPEMTMSYAHIHDSTMKKEYFKYQENLVNYEGVLLVKVQNPTEVPEELKWLKANILAQALPNGYCALPIQQGGCPHANACLSCSHFRTSAHFIPQHQQQLTELEKIIQVAKERGWTRQVEMNSQQYNNLKKIIVTLEKTT